MTTFLHGRKGFLFLSMLAVFGFFFFATDASAASVTVNCSGTAGSPTAVTESALAGDDVTFTDAGGDGVCALDEDINSSGNGAAASVIIEAGVVLTHTSGDADGIDIETTGNMTVTGDIDVNARGCQGATSSDGYGPDGSNVCTISTAGYTVSASNTTGGAAYGGDGGRGESAGTGGGQYGSPTGSVLMGSSSGGTGGVAGAAGGGYVRLDVAGVLTVNGSITADGKDGGSAGNQGIGGGSGGGIHITTVTMDGSGSIAADGGAGGTNNSFDGGGGGGGRIVITYTDTAGSDFSFASGSFSVDGGAAPGSPAEAGGVGSVYVNDTTADSVQVFHGFTFDNTDYSVTTWTMDASVSGESCDSSAATPSVTASGTLTLAGTLTCTSSSLTSFNLDGGTTVSMASGTTIDLSGSQNGADLDIAIGAGADVTWTNLTVTLPAESFFTIDDAVDIELDGTTAITANTQFTNLTEFILDSTASINTNELGCQSAVNVDGYGPDGSNVCTISTAGYGGGGAGFVGAEGGGHGGEGGNGVSKTAAGNTYDTNTAPVLLGSSGGAGGVVGGAGGGLIRIQATDITMTGSTLTANGGDGSTGSNQSSGGGSGGSIYISATSTLTMESGTVTTSGGAGKISSGFNSGSGGGGMVRIDYAVSGSAGTDTYISGLAASTVAAKGTGGANDGVDGTLSTEDLAPTFSSAQYEDNDGDGTIDRVVLDFSEDVSLGGTVANSRFTLTSPTGATGFGGSLSGNASISSGDVIITVSSAESNETGASGTVQIAYDDNSDDGTNNLQDAGGSILQTFSAQTITDNAGPLLVSSNPADSDSNVLTNSTIALTFTETITTGSFTYSCCGAGTDPGRSGAWTSSDTVYTITPSSNWTAGDDITINITAAPDGSSNAFVGAVSGSADPFTFTIANNGEQLTPGSGPNLAVNSVQLLAPNGGQFLTGGEIVTIQWSASGDKLASISLSYSTDHGRTYTTIAQGEDNDGAYLWTVPNVDASNAKVRASSHTSTGAELKADDSDNYLSITPSTTAETPQVNDDEGTEEVDTSTPAATMQRLDGTDIQLYEGNLFRGETLSGVYLVRNGQRYVFPSETVFSSYYPNFDDVVHVKDHYLQELDLGGRVTMAPGKMIKIQSDNRVFQVQSDGSISHIPDEATAIALYGTTWNQQITDISVTFWGDYPVGEALASL